MATFGTLKNVTNWIVVAFKQSTFFSKNKVKEISRKELSILLDNNYSWAGYRSEKKLLMVSSMQCPTMLGRRLIGIKRSFFSWRQINLMDEYHEDILVVPFFIQYRSTWRMEMCPVEFVFCYQKSIADQDISFPSRFQTYLSQVASPSKKRGFQNVFLHCIISLESRHN